MGQCERSLARIKSLGNRESYIRFGEHCSVFNCFQFLLLAILQRKKYAHTHTLSTRTHVPTHRGVKIGQRAAVGTIVQSEKNSNVDLTFNNGKCGLHKNVRTLFGIILAINFRKCQRSHNGQHVNWNIINCGCER